MLTITSYVQRTSLTDGSTYYALELTSSEPEVVKSQNGRFYITARRCFMSCTFSEAACVSMIGKQFPGTVSKVECDPYEYVVPETGETITRHHRYEYTPVESSSEEAVFA